MQCNAMICIVTIVILVMNCCCQAPVATAPHHPRPHVQGIVHQYHFRGVKVAYIFETSKSYLPFVGQIM